MYLLSLEHCTPGPKCKISGPNMGPNDPTHMIPDQKNCKITHVLLSSPPTTAWLKDT